jgi:WD40 repeat protein
LITGSGKIPFAGFGLLAQLIFALAVTSWGGGGAAAAETPNTPILRIETGNHTAVIHGLAVSADGARIATASFDGTVRIWSLPTLELLRTIRMPVGGGIEGAVYSVSFSPDGNTLVTSGWTGGWDGKDAPWCFYVIDLNDRDIRQTVCDLPRRVNHLTYSRDGKYLAIALKLTGGVRVYRTSDFKLIASDNQYGDACDWVEFDPAGRMITSSFDGKIRIYDQSFRLIASKTMPEGRKPDGLSVSPDGARIAVGYFEPEGNDPLWSPAVDVISAEDLSILFRPDLRGIDNGALWRVAWSADGKALYAGGTWKKGSKFQIRRWADGGKGKPFDFPAASSRVLRMAALPTGGVVFLGEVPYIGILGSNHRLTADRHVAVADFSEIGDALAVSADGLSVQFAFEPSGSKPAYFSLAKRTLEAGEPANGAKMAQPVTDDPNIDVRDWADSYRPTVNGTALELLPHEQSLALTFLSDGKGFILGTNWKIRRYDTAGNLIWATPVPYSARGVVVTPDDRLVVAAIGDGTIRWYAAETGNELLAFFAHVDRHRWVAWTRSGYYMASVGGDDLIGWQVNRGHEHAADYFSVSRFSDQFYRPDIVSRTLATLDEAKAVQFANNERGRRQPNEDAPRVAKLLPPVIEILDPPDGSQIKKAEITVRYRVRAPSGLPVEQIMARSDNRSSLDVFDPPDLDGAGQASGTLQIVVPQRDTEVVLFARNRYSTSEPAKIRLKWNGESSGVAAVKRKLYVLAIGVSDYVDRPLKLRYPAKDASDFVAALRRQEGKAYTEVVAKILTNDNAALPNIRDGLAWLGRNVKPDDIGMIFLAGHGFDDEDGTYHYLPREADIDDLEATTLPYTDLLAGLKGIAGSAVLFIDTCHAGDAMGRAGHASMDSIGLVSKLSQPANGVIVYASSTGDQYALESPSWQNGSFTKALVEGLDGAAEYHQRDYITTTMLEAYVKERVKDMTKNRQTPTANMPLAVADLLLARVTH